MKAKIFTLLIFNLFLVVKSFACDCGAQPTLSEKMFNPNNKKLIVFTGQVLKVGACNKLATCTFQVKELYFGNSKKILEAFFDCGSSCQMNFNPGEEWIIYGEYVQVEKIKIEACSRSRRLKQTNTIEAENIIYGMSTSDELDWLRKKIGTKNIKPNDEQKVAGHKNELPDAYTKALLLTGSIVGMVVFLLITKKIFK